MKSSRLCGVFSGILFTFCMAAAAQEKGYWHAENSSAKTITGAITTTEEQLVINYAAFTTVRIRSLEPAEARAAFDLESDAEGTGSLYRLNIPASQRFLHHNTLCAGDAAQWMASYVEGKSLRLAFFSGSAVPVLKPEAIANATNLCGIFTYSR